MSVYDLNENGLCCGRWDMAVRGGLAESVESAQSELGHEDFIEEVIP